MAVRYLKDICDDLINGIKGVHKEMDEKGLLTETTTFEEMADYAGKHVLLTEMTDEEYEAYKNKEEFKESFDEY